MFVFLDLKSTVLFLQLYADIYVYIYIILIILIIFYITIAELT